MVARNSSKGSSWSDILENVLTDMSASKVLRFFSRLVNIQDSGLNVSAFVQTLDIFDLPVVLRPSFPKHLSVLPI